MAEVGEGGGYEPWGGGGVLPPPALSESLGSGSQLDPGSPGVVPACSARTGRVSPRCGRACDAPGDISG